MTELFIRTQSVDHLGRIIPAVTLAEATRGTPTPRRVVEILAQAAQYGQRAAYNAVVRWALLHGITHGPADLAGHQCPLAEISE